MPQSITFLCPACRSRLRTSARFGGRSGKCPHCGQTVVVPPTAPAEEAPVLVLDDGQPTPRLPWGR
jgi:hypothetical protein